MELLQTAKILTVVFITVFIFYFCVNPRDSVFNNFTFAIGVGTLATAATFISLLIVNFVF